MKFYRKIMKNHEISSKNHQISSKNHQISSKKQSKLNQMLNRFSFDSRYVFEQNDHILSRKIRTKSLFILTILRVSLMQKWILFFDSMMR